MSHALLLLLALAQGPRFDASEVARHVQFLASPALEGRMTPGPGLAKAADYLAAQFRSYGLKEGPNKGYRWNFEVAINQRPAKNNMLVFQRLDGKSFSFQLGKDFVPLFGSKDLSIVRGELVFVGYGADEKDYETENEEAGGERPFDVKDKVVLMFARTPSNLPQLSRSAKAELAREHGAAGVIFLGPSAPGRPQLPRTVRGQGLAGEGEMVGVGMSEGALATLIDVESMHTVAVRHESRVLPFTVRMVTETEPNKALVSNVVGYLPGRDPKLKDEFILIGAHYDHLGYGEIGSRSQTDAIHFGADDNASGAAGVLALAKHFASKKNNRRTLVFLLFSGEEEGLLGSEAWAKGHPNSLERAAAMINLDMIGRLRKGELFAFGVSSSDVWEGILDKIKVEGVEIKSAPQTRGDSDQASFARRNVPVLFFNTGLHDEYHTERDTADTIDTEGIVKTLVVVAQAIQAVDDLETKPLFAKDAVLGNLPGDRDAERTQRAIRVGFIPDMVAGGPGLRITGVSPGSPALKAGFKEGDRILEFNGVKVTDLESLQAAYLTAKAGDTVKIVFQRDNVRREQLVTVEGRGG